MPFKQHPSNPYKVIYESRKYDLPKREWVGLTEEEIDQGLLRSPYALQSAGAWRDGVRWAEEILNRRNT